MGAGEFSTKTFIKDLSTIADAERVLSDPETLKTYAQDTSLAPSRRPDVVVKAKSTAEVQKVVKYANEHGIPVTPRSSATGFYGAAIPQEGGIVIDMTLMKRILRLDTRNKWVLVEPGVTYGELQKELAKHGMRAVNPLLPHKDKSVITSLLEREPRLTPKHHLDETIMTMEVVLPTGELFRTGAMAIPASAPEKVPDEAHSDLCNSMGPGIDWYRLIPGSLGTYGIVTAMNMKIAFIPTKQKVIFFGFKNLEDSIEAFYKIERKQIGDECFLLNSSYLASILASAPDDIDHMRSILPPYVLILNVTAGEWLPEEKMDYQMEALEDISRTYLLKPMESLPGVQEAEKVIADRLYQPWDNGAYWKFRAKGASQEIFFLTTLKRSPEFLNIVKTVARAHDYPVSHIGLYLQPKQWGRAFQMEVSFPYNPEDMLERQQVENIYMQASQELINKGAFFYRVYGPWADMVYSRTGNLHDVIKKIKHILDPNMILNPGKLGF
ncbi:MAG: FAD-binding oxidoreductase [Proteobacteria bacterium]|nr:FAD-binding oxidoreductase [Pseudomonadota bacterium]